VPVAAAVALAACGSGGSSSTSSSAGSGTSAKTVSVKQVPGVGNVLVDSNGMPLYAANIEASGKVACGAGCTAFWKPLTLGSGAPSAASNVGKLGVVKRPDGTRQVTDNGKPLYTFSQDSAGKATGNGFSDSFGGHDFTWHVVSASGGTASSGGKAGTSPSPNSYGSGGY
jgi:predicted lipoprotein with Yx(FWY)xxD motif